MTNPLTLRPVVINRAASGTLEAIPGGRRFLVTMIVIEAESNVSVRFDEEATPMTGDINLLAANGPYTFKNGGEPILVSQTSGNDFKITLGSAVQVNGWALLSEIA